MPVLADAPGVAETSAGAPARITPSPAQPQPNNPGEIKAFVARLALCRAALTAATSSLTGEMRLGSMAEQIEGQSLERFVNL